MVKVIQDNKLLIDFFHESLSNETLSLYISQDKSKIKKKKKKWKDTIGAVIYQYKFNMKMVFNRTYLQAMEKKGKELVKENT
jgi:hypothetical protein